MTDVRIATSAEQPINSDGFVSTVTGSEGDLVGLDASGELIAADASTGVAVPAIGVLATPVDDPSTYPTGQFEYAAKQAESTRAPINDVKVGVVRYGVELENVDADWSFTEGETVYLSETAGGFTQTAPSDPGDIVQSVGVAIEQEVIILDVQDDYSTVSTASGDATFSGDASATAFTIAHGLTATPSMYSVQPTSSEAAAEHYVSAVDATDITVTFSAAPASGTDNVTFNWHAEE